MGQKNPMSASLCSQAHKDVSSLTDLEKCDNINNRFSNEQRVLFNCHLDTCLLHPLGLTGSRNAVMKSCGQIRERKTILYSGLTDCTELTVFVIYMPQWRTHY